MTWNEERTPAGWRSAGSAGRPRRDRAPGLRAPVGTANPWFLLKAVPALERAARIEAGTERPDAVACLRLVERSLEEVGNAAERQLALRWLRLLLDEVGVAAARDSGSWRRSETLLDVQAEAAALARDATLDKGLLHLLEASRLLSPSGRRAPPLRLSAAGPDLFAPVDRSTDRAARRLLLAGSPGAGKSSLLRQAGRRLRARETSNLTGIAPRSDERIVQVESAASATAALAPPVASGAMLVLTGLDRIAGWDVLFPAEVRGGTCGAHAVAGENAADRLAAALHAHLLDRLSSERDPGRRASLLGAAGHLAATCGRLARAGEGGSGWASVHLAAAPPDGPSTFARPLFDTMVPGETGRVGAWRPEIAAGLAFILISLAGLSLARCAADPAAAGGAAR